MSAPSRSSLISATQKVLKKHYKPVAPDARRSVLETFLYGCLLDSAPYTEADAAWTALQDEFFDWNEVRVATNRELAEVFTMLQDPMKAAQRIRGALQGVFESLYSYDLEAMQKENLGKATQKLASFSKASPFAVSYVVQSALGGHSIPLDNGALDLMRIIDLITDKERAQRRVPGLERAIPKSKGRDFGSLLHQMVADFVSNPYSPSIHKIILEINPQAKERLPKRPAKTTKKKTAKKKTAARKATAANKTAKKKKAKATANSRSTSSKTTAKKKSRVTKRKPK